MGKAYLTTYDYNCELAFNCSDGTSEDILVEGLQYILITHDYADSIMPVIYMSIRVFPSLYNKMVPDQGKGKIYLKLYRTRKQGSTSSAPKKVIYDEFDYYMTDDPNTHKELDIASDSKTAYKTCLLGLIKMDLQKKNKKTFESIYKNTNTQSLIQSATSDFKMVIQPFDNNKYYKQFMCPTLTSIGQFISYINSKASFYKGSYMYYMDFEKTYLRSNDGSYIDAKDGDLKNIAFDIRDLTYQQALTSGMVEDIDQDSYIIYVSGIDAKIIIDRSTSSLIGTVSGINMSDNSKKESIVNTKNITNIGTSDGSLMIISQDENAASNLTTRIAESSDTLVITKIDMDSRVFTPNKRYLLSNYEDNPKYCGVYYMTKQEDIYLRVGDIIKCQMTITLKKCADFI